MPRFRTDIQFSNEVHDRMVKALLEVNKQVRREEFQDIDHEALLDVVEYLKNLKERELALSGQLNVCHQALDKRKVPRAPLLARIEQVCSQLEEARSRPLWDDPTSPRMHD